MGEIIEKVELSPCGSRSNEVEMSFDDLMNRVINDCIRMQKMKADRETKDPDSEVQSLGIPEEAIFKIIAKIMDACNVQGFVYGIIPEKGKPLSGSSDSLHDWWQDMVKFEQAAPAAIAEFLPEIMQETAQVLNPNSFIQEDENLKLVCGKGNSLGDGKGE